MKCYLGTSQGAQWELGEHIGKKQKTNHSTLELIAGHNQQHPLH